MIAGPAVILCWLFVTAIFKRDQGSGVLRVPEWRRGQEKREPDLSWKLLDEQIMR